MDDPKKACLFIVQFLGLRPALIDFTNENDIKATKSFYSENYYIPDRLFFTLNFFDHPTFKTEPICYEN